MKIKINIYNQCENFKNILKGLQIIRQQKIIHM